MSRCAFCGGQQRLGSHFFAHRYAQRKIETVKVCAGCEPNARQAGYVVAEREPSLSSDARDEQGTTPP